jgi:membrane protein required for beta-lactamase induction
MNEFAKKALLGRAVRLGFTAARSSVGPAPKGAPSRRNFRGTICAARRLSMIEDTRKLLQDFPAPELRELSALVGALEARMDARFDSAERLASERHAQTMQAIGRLADVSELRERITRIEARQAAG